MTPLLTPAMPLTAPPRGLPTFFALGEPRLPPLCCPEAVEQPPPPTTSTTIPANAADAARQRRGQRAAEAPFPRSSDTSASLLRWTSCSVAYVMACHGAGHRPARRPLPRQGAPKPAGPADDGGLMANGTPFAARPSFWRTCHGTPGFANACFLVLWPASFWCRPSSPGGGACTCSNVRQQWRPGRPRYGRCGP